MWESLPFDRILGPAFLYCNIDGKIQRSQVNRMSKRLLALRGIPSAAIRDSGAAALLAMVFCGGGMFSLYPFGVCFAAAMPAPLATGAMIGAAIGYLLRWGTGVRYLFALGALAALRWLFKDNHSRAAAPLAAALALLVPGAVALSILGVTPYGAMMLLCEVALAAGGTLFLAATCAALVAEGRTLIAMGRLERASAAMCALMLLLSLQPLTIGEVSVMRIAGAASVLFFAVALREGGGAAAGVAVGVCCLSVSPQSLFLPAAYGVAGLLGGAFSGLSRFLATLAFVAAHGCVALFFREATAFYSLIEVLCASAVFMLIPGKMIGAVARLSSGRGAGDRQLREKVSHKLSATAKALQSVAETVTEVSGALGAPDEDIMSVFETAMNYTCRSCRNNVSCAVGRYSELCDSFAGAAEHLRRDGRLDKHNCPVFLKVSCIKLDEFLAEVNRGYKSFVLRRQEKAKREELRGLSVSQLCSLADVLQDIERDVSEIKSFDPRRASQLRDALAAEHYSPVSVDCAIDIYGRLAVDMLFEELDRRDLADICDVVSTVSGHWFSEPAVRETMRGTAVSLLEKPSFEVDVDSYSIPYSGAKYCGDASAHFVDDHGGAHIVLSDGMGTGARAAVDGNMVCSLMSMLLKTGFTFDAAFGIINASLIVKSGDESLATVDALTVDLYTGSGRMLKAGAVPSFVLRGGRFIELSCGSLPIGIISEIKAGHLNFQFEPGDILIMMTDGAAQPDGNWLLSYKDKLPKTPAGIARQLALDAKKRLQPEYDDDITVVAAMIGKGA